MVCALVCSASDVAERFYKAGLRAERAGDTVHAYLLFSRAAALDPRNVEYAMRKAATRTLAALTTREEKGPDPAEPSGEALEQTDFNEKERIEAREAIPPPRLRGSPGKHDFDLRGEPRTIFEKVAEAFGITVVFEADYQTPPPFVFRMNGVGFEEAFRALETVSNSFFVPINDRLALVVRDTPQKRTERMPAMSVAIPIPERMTVQDAQELFTAVQQTLDIRKMNVDPTRHLIFVRDQVSKAEAARQMFRTLSQIRPQVAVDVEFLSIDKNSALNYGIQLANQFPIVNFVGFQSLPAAARSLANIFGPMTPFALGIADSQIFATLSKSRTENFISAQVVSLDGQAATLHVGQRYPIITNGYYGNATGTGQVFAPPPTVNFEDLGVVLKITPSIHEDGGVTLDIDSEFKALAAQNPVNGIPIISNRKFTGKIRVRDGEWAVLAGLISVTDFVSKAGWPGLADIPILGRIFSKNDVEKASSEVLIVFKPHLTNMPQWEIASHPIWVGTETRPLTVY